jgi:hypothetical protein
MEKLAQEVRGYADAEIDDVKLQAAKGLSRGTGAMASILLIVQVAAALVLLLAFSGVLLLGEWMGSYGYAALIVAGVLLLLLIILWLCRSVLFKNTFVGLFTSMLSPEDAKVNPISTQKQLDEALARSKNRVRRSEENISARIQNARTYYAPKHLVSMGVKRDVVPVLLRLIGRRKKK